MQQRFEISGLGQDLTLSDHGGPNEPHLPLSLPPEGGGGTQAAPAFSPSPPWGGEGRGEEGDSRPAPQNR